MYPGHQRILFSIGRSIHAALKGIKCNASLNEIYSYMYRFSVMLPQRNHHHHRRPLRLVLIQPLLRAYVCVVLCD